MKVLLIRNNEISIEFIEEHLARNGTEGEVLVAMPEELALEIAEGIDFDLVVCGVEGYLKKVIEDFLFKVKQISKGSYSIAVLRRETLKEMGPVFFNNIDDFITSPVDSDEFALRLMKAISNAKNHHPADTPVFGIGRLHDVSSPSSKLFDDDLQDVSIREVVNEEGVSATEVEDTSRQEEIDYPTSEQDTGHMTFDELSYDELLRRRELMLEREAESRALEEELMTTDGSPEAEAEEAVTIEPEPLNDELSYDELLRRRELMLEREAESRALEEELMTTAGSPEAEAEEAVTIEPEPLNDELSYDELLRRRELMLEREAESRALEEELMTTAGSPEAEAEEAVTIEPEPLNDELSYDENPGQGELMLERESEVRFEDVESIGYSMQDPDFISAGEVDMKQADQVSEADASIAEQPRDSKPEVRSVKEEKLQEEIDLLKHLRKDYGAKTSKVERFGLKKEKKRKKAEAEKEKSASKSGRGIFTIIARVMALMLVLIAGATVYFYAASNIGDGVPAIAGYKLTAMRTATMEPTLRLGDLVISVDVSVDDIKEKDIITFKVGNSQGMVECHRVVRIETSPEGKTLLITQGDGMTSEDEFPVEHDMIVGKVTRYIPFAGFIVNVDTLRFALASVK
ncbi:signal peptidase I [Youngiibacter fragilis]|uniref:Signal peptidase I n=1 Tax=Youngiibacter fragilis 232.1 TaxID=994573 RepID=V7I1F2_9CLOT|nr:signal peptidase I [Youngiibacter fragilis]ETA79688.1 hypothetical protein T472_0215710 [Youngiibacter fragilis 232.1]